MLAKYRNVFYEKYNKKNFSEILESLESCLVVEYCLSNVYSILKRAKDDEQYLSYVMDNHAKDQGVRLQPNVGQKRLFNLSDDILPQESLQPNIETGEEKNKYFKITESVHI